MPSYLVETYLARGRAGERTTRERRARSVAEELTREGTRVSFERLIHVPEDEICFFVFDAPSGQDAALAAQRARLEPVRVVEAISSRKEKMKSKWSLALVAGVLTAVTLFAASAQANAPRVTQGDAQAIFESFASGGWAVRLHGGTLEGAPADFLPDSLARISPNPPWEGRHFCSLDWHVITLTQIDGHADGDSRTTEEIREYLSDIDLFFTLDGAPLDTMRTPIKRFLNPERFQLVDAYWFAEGQVMAPADLSVGQHSLQLEASYQGGEHEVAPPIAFFVDAPGEGTCL